MLRNYWPWAWLEEDTSRADWTRVCADCWRFPNRCDHLPARYIRLLVLA